MAILSRGACEGVRGWLPAGVLLGNSVIFVRSLSYVLKYAKIWLVLVSGGIREGFIFYYYKTRQGIRQYLRLLLCLGYI